MLGPMSLELVNLLVAAGTFVVIGASATAALIQLRHLRASNELDALLDLERQFHDPELQRAFRFVQGELHEKLRDRGFRSELERIGFIDTNVHPEIYVLNWFSTIGAVLKHALVDEATFMELFGRLAAQYWELLAPVIALVRRRRGSAQFHNFEYLAIRARKWVSDHPDGFFPRGIPRIPIVDEWRDVDESQTS